VLREKERTRKKAEKQERKRERKKKASDKKLAKVMPCADPLAQHLDSGWEDQDQAVPGRGTSKQAKDVKDKPKPSNDVLHPHPTVFLDNTPIQIPLSTPEILTVKYSMHPRVHNSSFLLHACYEFNTKSSANLLGLVKAQNFRFCPHTTSSTNSSGGQILPDTSCIQNFIRSPKGKTKVYETLEYEASCRGCETDYQVGVECNVVGVPRVERVLFDFWYFFCDGNDIGFLPAATKGVAESCAMIEKIVDKGGIRKLWDDAGVVDQVEEDEDEDVLERYGFFYSG
jgi:hypothetical protein